MIRYTDQQREFLYTYVPGHHYKEIVEEFNRRFPENKITLNNVKNFIANNKLNTGFNGRFEKGHEPTNKNRKGYCAPGSEKGWFKKGHSMNKLPVGSIRVRGGQKHRKQGKQAEVFIKIAEPNKWRLYSRYLWEQYYGEIPKGYVVCTKDGDSTNIVIENLRLISRKALVVLNSKGWNYQGEARDIGITMAELHSASTRRKKNG